MTDVAGFPAVREFEDTGAASTARGGQAEDHREFGRRLDIESRETSARHRVSVQIEKNDHGLVTRLEIDRMWKAESKEEVVAIGPQLRPLSPVREGSVDHHRRRRRPTGGPRYRYHSGPGADAAREDRREAIPRTTTRGSQTVPSAGVER